MNIKRTFYKQLNEAEVGNTGTHEIYMRMPNDFDYQDFFQQDAVLDGTVNVITFEVETIDGEIYPLRFVHYINNKNKERRIPSLGFLFKKYNLQAGDIIKLDSITEDDKTRFFISFVKGGVMSINPKAILTKRSQDGNFLLDSNKKPRSKARQVIYFGAPGTGKSHKVNESIKDKKNDAERITFHPDTDYSSFVGCYKPVETKSVKAKEIRKFSKEELIEILQSYLDDGQTYPIHRFAFDYWKSLNHLSTSEIKEILDGCNKESSMYTEILKSKSVGEFEASKEEPSQITYTFVPQAFTKAYVAAWHRYADKLNGKDAANFTLVIEEINRGNCAQIFGDIFQLLDRDENGFSTYGISPDQDLVTCLTSMLKDVATVLAGAGYDKIATGEEMKLPPTLSIIATMNTSDQSLFPIDSAFKRRWDWEYIPIDYAPVTVTPFVIKVGGETYSWGDFIKVVNGRIEDLTRSEDKQLGYFFVTPAKGNEITTEQFVSKVLFYLWSDIYKDYYGRGNSLFKKIENGPDFSSFNKFFGSKGIQTDLVKAFIKELGLNPIEEENQASEQPHTEQPEAE